MGRIGAFGRRRGALLGVTVLVALAMAACFRAPRPPQPPQAAFSVSTAPLVASFTDESTGTITSRSWDFGDGASSTDQNPTHQYANHGDYTVTLTVTGPGGSDTETKTVTIKPPAPVASFAVEPPSGTVPLTVTLTNTSTGLVDTIAWDLDGDGVFNDATGQTATRTFDTAGSHTVGLSVTGPGGTSTTSQTIPTTLPPAPIAVLNAQPEGGVTPLLVSLDGCASSGAITAFTWDFESDGIVDQTNPCQTQHTFTTPGSYVVTMTVQGPGGTATASQTITVNANTPPAVAITAPANGATFTTGSAVSFTGTATDAEDGNLSSSIQWNSSVSGQLGNGASIQTSNLAIGTHTITASVTDSSGAPASASITITVNPAPPAPPVASFLASPSLGIAPLTVAFTDTSTGTVTSRSWTFGDQSGSTLQNLTHTYNDPGLYTVTLTVTGPGGSSSSSKQILVESGGGGDPCPGRCEPPPTRDPGDPGRL
jgi:PKD repeat protein